MNGNFILEKRRKGRSFDYAKSWPINRAHNLRLKLILDEVPVISTIVERLVDRVCSTRCTVQVRPLNAGEKTEVWSNPDVNMAFDNQLNLFERSVVTSWAIYGYAVGYYTFEEGTNSTNRTPKNVILNAFDPNDCEVRWRYTDNENIEYAVFPLVRDSKTAGSINPDSVAENSEKKEIPNSFVIPFGVLDRKTSIFKSHLSMAKSHCGDLRLFGILSRVAMIRQVFPLIVKNITEDNFKLPIESITPDILSSVNVGINDPGNVRFSATEVHSAVETAVRNSMTDIISNMDANPRNISTRVHDFFSNLDPFSSTLQEDLFKMIGEDPLKPSYNLVPGMTINKDTPESKLPPELLVLIEKREDDVREIFGLPKDSKESKITANVVKNETQYLYTTQNYRVRLEEIIKDLFLDIYGICFTSYRERIPALKTDKTLTSFPVYVKVKTSEKSETKKSYRIEQSKKYRLDLDRVITVLVSYSPTTSSELAEVVELHERGVISFEAFQVLALSAARVPMTTHLKLTTEEYKKIDKLKIKELMTKPEEKEGQPKPKKQSKAKRQKLDSMDEIERKTEKKEQLDKD